MVIKETQKGIKRGSQEETVQSESSKKEMAQRINELESEVQVLTTRLQRAKGSGAPRGMQRG